MKIKDISISWTKTESVEFAYEAFYAGARLNIRMNDFPKEPLYTLIINGVIGESFDDWPFSWIRNNGEYESDETEEL